jgi:LuxR family transcriptional regulator, maltose regulon positive regulatory protein
MANRPRPSGTRWTPATGPTASPCWSTTGSSLALQDNASAIREVAARLPPEIVRETLELGVLAFDRFEQLDHRAAQRHLQLVRQRQSTMPEGRRDRMAVMVGLLELSAARRSGQLERVLATAKELFAIEVTTGPPIIGVDQDEGIRAMALLNLGAAELWTGRLGDAEHHLRDAVTTAEGTGFEFLWLEGLGQLALLQLTRGRLDAARRTGRTAVDLAEWHGWTRRHQAGGAYLALATVNLERNDLEARPAPAAAVPGRGRLPGPGILAVLTSVGGMHGHAR